MGLMKAGAADALYYVLWGSSYPRKLALYTVPPAWDIGGGEEVSTDGTGYQRTPIAFQYGAVDFNDIIVMRNEAVSFGPFEVAVEGIVGWGIWGPTAMGGGGMDQLIAAGVFVDSEGEPTMLNVDVGEELRIAAEDLLIGIAPVEVLD